MENTRIVYLSYSKRLASLFIDAAIFLLGFCLCYFLAFAGIYSVEEETDLRLNAFLNAGLYTETEEGYVLREGDSYLDYMEMTKGYYVGTPNQNSYFDSGFYILSGGTRKPYTVEQYNEAILGVTRNGDSTYFTLEGVGEGEYAVVKQSLYENGELSEETSEGLLTYFMDAFNGIFSDLYNDPFYEEAVNSAKAKTICRQALSYYVSYSLPYVLLPLALGKGRGLGLLLVKGECVSPLGVRQRRLWHLGHSVPSLLVGLSLVFSTDFYLFLILAVLLCTGNAVSTAMTRQRRSLSDLLSYEMKVDSGKSRPFSNVEEVRDFNDEEEEELLSISNNYYVNGD